MNQATLEELTGLDKFHGEDEAVLESVDWDEDDDRGVVLMIEERNLKCTSIGVSIRCFAIVTCRCTKICFIPTLRVKNHSGSKPHKKSSQIIVLVQPLANSEQHIYLD
jgi:hypothetical protein